MSHHASEKSEKAEESAKLETLKYESYYSEVEAINDQLEKDISEDVRLLDHLQAEVDALNDKYGNDEKLGADRYAIYQAQALINYRRGHTLEATAWMRRAVATKGASFPLAEKFLANVDARSVPAPKRRRINRSSCIVSYVVSLIIYGVSVVVFVFLTALVDGFRAVATSSEALKGDVAVPIIVWLLCIPLLLYVFKLYILRLHDLGQSGWLSVLVMAPFVSVIFGLVLIFVKGEGENKYGPPPPKGIKLVRPFS